MVKLKHKGQDKTLPRKKPEYSFPISVVWHTGISSPRTTVVWPHAIATHSIYIYATL